MPVWFKDRTTAADRSCVVRCHRLLMLAFLVALTVTAGYAGPAVASATAPRAGVQVRGAKLVDLAGRPVRLLGVNRAGGEYACAQGWGFFEGPTDAGIIAAMASWRINAVRVPLNA